MRNETCLFCQIPGAGDPDAQKFILISESVGRLTHHHHTVRCGGCGQWWFDDLVIGGLGIPVPSRRDTMLCECDDDLPQYAISVILVPKSEAECGGMPGRYGCVRSAVSPPR